MDARLSIPVFSGLGHDNFLQLLGSNVRRTHLIRIAPLWILCLIAGSVLPGSVKEMLGTSANMAKMNGEPQLVSMQVRHRLYHFFSFGFTALLLLLIARTPTQRFYASLATIALGLAIEFAQHWICQAPVEWWDVRDDFYAVVAAWLLGEWPALRHVLVKDS